MLALVLAFACAVPCLGTTYYVSSSSGKDGNSGTLPGTAWRTVARVNAQAFEPGDFVLFRRGNSWQETLTPHNSGTRRDPIVFAAYGSGPRPILNSSPGEPRDHNIENNEQSFIVYRDLELRGARQGLRIYAWRGRVRGITLENSLISTEPSVTHGTMSAGVYASVGAGRIEQLTIRRNHFIPHPTGLEHWGVYFVKGVDGFAIEDNSFEPAGEDAICIWHSAHGVVARNRGGGNGENTIDVKDSHDIVVTNNLAENDAEYNIVVHSVDAGVPTYAVSVEHNTCRRGGQAGKLTAGIALLFVRKTRVSENIVEEPYQAGIYVKDWGSDSGNTVFDNRVLRVKPTPGASAIVLEHAPGTRAFNNRDSRPLANQ